MKLWTNSKATIELRELVENGVDLWDFDYPSFYKGEEKKAFEQKVIDHFYMRQIGAETPGRFLHYFRRTMREIMPYYIQRYQSVELMNDPEIRPLDNYNMIEEYSETASETGSENLTANGTNTSSTQHTSEAQNQTSGKNKGISVRSDTPQNKIDLLISMESDTIGAIEYATEINQTHDQNQTTGSENLTGSSSGTDTMSQTSTGEKSTEGERKHTLTRRGNIGVTTYAQLLEGYRQTFLNIDMEVINELEICFLGVY